MDKRKPHYPLRDIQLAFGDPAALNRSFVSKQGADALKMDDAAVVAVIAGLSRPDFDKSMTSHANNRIWQDVYRPRVNGRELYVNLHSIHVVHIF